MPKRNGRAAWTSLLNHYEGSTFRERVAQEALKMLRIASYSGPQVGSSDLSIISIPTYILLV